MRGDATIDVVIDLIYREIRRWPPDDTLPDQVERAHQAICLYLERNADRPFQSAREAVAWIWTTFGNLGRWEKPPAATPLDQLAGDGPTSEDRPPDEPDHQDAEADATRAAEVILRYYTRTCAPHSGRLSLTADEVRVVRSVAHYALNDADYRVSTSVYQLLSDELDMPPQQVKRTYYAAKQAFVRVYYIIGALAGDDALTSEQTLAEAVERFRSSFRGQNEWSILAFAARCAIPAGGYARVDPNHYDKAVLQDRSQADRLGWTPQSPQPAMLLHEIEHQAAEVLGQPAPHCVLSHPNRCPLCGHPINEVGHE